MQVDLYNGRKTVAVVIKLNDKVKAQLITPVCAIMLIDSSKEAKMCQS